MCARQSTRTTTTTIISRSASAIRCFRRSPSRSTIRTRPRSMASRDRNRSLVRRAIVHLGVGMLHSAAGNLLRDRSARSRPSRLAPAATGPAAPTCINLTGHQADLRAQCHFQSRRANSLRSGWRRHAHATPRLCDESAQWATLFENPALGDRLERGGMLGAQLEWKHGPGSPRSTAAISWTSTTWRQ